jgi:lipoprotein signal peptidase
VQLLTETLGNDRYAIERAGDYWRSAMRALAKRNAEGYRTDVSGVMIAKLCALRVLSPGLFDAIRLDAPALTRLERWARMQTPAYESRDEWAKALAHDPRLTKLFATPPSFIGVETRHLATALRLVHTGDEELTRQTQSLAAKPVASEVKGTGTAAPAIAAPTNQPIARPIEPNRSHRRKRPASAAAPAPIWTLTSVAAVVFIVDRLAKMAVQSVEGFQTGTTLFGRLVYVQPPPEASLMDTSLAIGVELVGLALCILIAAFAAKQADGARAKAYGLIVGGLAANLFDRVTFGATMNYLHLANLPVFNLAHLALLAGAVLLTFAVLTGSPRDARSHDAGDLAHE